MPEFLILIVDEDKDNQKFLAKILKRKNRRLIHSTSTGEAEKIVYEQPVDMIILDTGEGKHCGISFMRKVFGNNSAPSVPVFMMSRKKDLPTKLMSYNSGALRFLTKPINVEELANGVEWFETKRKQCAAF